ncbi:hypothetical protein STCU_10670 [Strigomonas culicis]|uniref:RING-type domain-containing protein n=1 Tax=Strigomonas culicis TaxID=28005 RepID=S9TKJ7_9TRYP|nr:hypothetical protein STCU_10670 [Strigomonas culicis]|eukprot:EPY17349.1 hypothetical protein STCU_10670 [Strigomonas culicis]
MLFLEDALRHAECPICLLPLQGGGTASQNSGAAPTTASAQGPPSPPFARGGAHFDITFAPGVRETLTDFHRSSPDYDSDDGVVMLQCGHIYHYACALQLFEHEREKSKCPLCRHAVRKEKDLIPFRPQRRGEMTAARASAGGLADDGEPRARSHSVSSVVSATSASSGHESSGGASRSPLAPARANEAATRTGTAQNASQRKRIWRTAWSSSRCASSRPIPSMCSSCSAPRSSSRRAARR